MPTVPANASHDQYVGNGSLTIFAYTFKIFDAADIAVYLNDVLQSSGFSVDGLEISTGGNVTFITAPGANVAIDFIRSQPISQLSVYIPNDGLPAHIADRIEDDFDKGTMVDQMLSQQHGSIVDQITAVEEEVAATLARALLLDEASAFRDLTLPDPVSGNLLTWKSNLTGMQNTTLPTTATPVGTLQLLTEAERLVLGPPAGTLVQQTDKIKGVWTYNGADWVQVDRLDVRWFGAKGDGVTDDSAAIQAAVDAAFGPAGAPNGSGNATLNKELYFSPGAYTITTPIVFTLLKGARIMGAGRFVVTITNANGSVFVTDGCGYSHFEGFELRNSGVDDPVFALNWTGITGGAQLQSNTLVDMYFTGGSYGVEIAKNTLMGSENLFLNCFWFGSELAGLRTGGFNALQNSVIGGNFQNCNGRAIFIDAGEVNVIAGVGFQNQTNLWDIEQVSTAFGATNIIGCRTESVNFARFNQDHSATISGCNQTSAGGLIFLEPGGGRISIEGCNILSAQINLTQNSFISCKNTFFHNEVPAIHSALSYKTAFIEFENIRLGSDPVKIIKARQRWVPSSTPDLGWAIQDYEISESSTTRRTSSNAQNQGDGLLEDQVNAVFTNGDGDVVTLPSLVGLNLGAYPLTVMNRGTQTLQIYPFVGEDLGAGLDTSIFIASGAAAKFQAYYNVPPVASDNFLDWHILFAGWMAGSIAWDPGSIAIGAMEAQIVTAFGAKLGDFAQASLGVDVQNLTLTAAVTAANTVTVVLANNTAGAVDLASSTLNVRVQANL